MSLHILIDKENEIAPNKTHPDELLAKKFLATVAKVLGEITFDCPDLDINSNLSKSNFADSHF